MGLKEWMRDRAEVKAAKQEAYEDEKEKADAERQKKAIDKAKVAGKEKAHTGFQMPKPNPTKIAAIKGALSGLSEKAATANERMNAGDMDNFTGNKDKGTSSGSHTTPKKKSVTVKKRSESIKKEPVSVEKMTPEDQMDDFNKRMKETLGY